MGPTFAGTEMLTTAVSFMEQPGGEEEAQPRSPRSKNGIMIFAFFAVH